MEKIKKYLLKLGRDDRNKIKNVIKLITENKVENLNIKKLRGYINVFRVRVGNHRVIYRKKENIMIILHIGHHN